MSQPTQRIGLWRWARAQGVTSYREYCELQELARIEGTSVSHQVRQRYGSTQRAVYQRECPRKESDLKKSVYVVSALRTDSSSLGCLKKFEKESDAVEHAKAVMEMRAGEGKPQLTFYVLKTVAVVTTKAAPVTVRKIK